MSFSLPKDAYIEKEFLIYEDNYFGTFIGGSKESAILSTPAMIGLMENITRILIDEYLPKEFTSVGTEVCVKHLAAAPRGSKVKVMSKLLIQNNREAQFQVTAWLNDLKVGEGTHTRFIINRERFLSKAKSRIN